MTIDFHQVDQGEHGQLTDPDTLQPLDPDVADYIRATLCRQRYDREQAERAAIAKATVCQRPDPDPDPDHLAMLRDSIRQVPT